MRITGWIFAAVIAFGTVACGSAESSNGDGPGGGGPPPMPVEVATAVRDTVVDEILATGEIEATQSIDLHPEIDGRLVQILAQEGSVVRRGAPLFKIDDAELRAQVAQLEAQRDLTQQALARTRELLDRNASSQADLEEAEANSRSMNAQLELQQVRLARTVVRAPFAGVVGERRVSIGDYVTSSTTLTTLQTLDPQRAAFKVPERHAERLAEGQEIRFEVAAVPGKQFTGVVDFVDPRVELPGRVITVKARVPNPDGELKPGMFMETRLATEVRPDAVVVPEEAILPLQSAMYVWVVVDGAATRREVEIGVRRPGDVEIRSGVAADEQVVVGGLERLSEGAPVMPMPVDGEAAESGAPETPDQDPS